MSEWIATHGPAREPGNNAYSKGDVFTDTYLREYTILGSDHGWYRVCRSDGANLNFRTGQVESIRYRKAPPEVQPWIDERANEPGWRCHQVGDQYRGASSSSIYTIQKVLGPGVWLIHRSSDDAVLEKHTGQTMSRAYRLGSKGGSPVGLASARAVAKPLQAPRLREVVCSGCGRGLGDFVDVSSGASTSRRGLCCSFGYEQ